MREVDRAFRRYSDYVYRLGLHYPEAVSIRVITPGVLKSTASFTFGFIIGVLSLYRSRFCNVFIDAGRHKHMYKELEGTQIICDFHPRSIFSYLKFSSRNRVYLGFIDILFKRALCTGRRVWLIPVHVWALFALLFLPTRIVCVLWEDTQPVGATLSHLFKNRALDIVILFSHGLHANGVGDYSTDGICSDLVCILSPEQRRFFRGRPTFNFGLTYPSKVVEGQVSRIVLVEHSGNELGKEARVAQNLLMKLCQHCKKFQLPVCFKRRNPSSKSGQIDNLGATELTEPASITLNGERSLFIGFSSTLLFEAYVHGHRVISLRTPLIPGSLVEVPSMDLNYFIENINSRKELISYLEAIPSYEVAPCTPPFELKVAQLFNTLSGSAPQNST